MLREETGTDSVRLADGLTIRLLTGRVVFTCPTPVLLMATAALRGLAGTLLYETDREAFDRWFKPQGDRGQQPPAYVFLPLHDGVEVRRDLPFRIACFDATGQFADRFQQALNRAPDRPFGQRGVRVDEVHWLADERAAFVGFTEPAIRLKLHLCTPLRLSQDGTWVQARDLTLGHVIRSGVARINQLSRWYGNGVQLDPVPYLAAAAFTRDHVRHLADMEAGRHSVTQGHRLSMTGVTGRWEIGPVTAPLFSLLSVLQVVHTGQHAAVGCGHIEFED